MGANIREIHWQRVLPPSSIISYLWQSAATPDTLQAQIEEIYVTDP